MARGATRVMQEADLQRFLSHATGRPVELRLNDNRHSLVSCRAKRFDGPLVASVHRMFLTAPDSVRAALAEFLIRPNPANRRVIRAFAATAPPVDKPQRETQGTPIGHAYDLGAIAHRLNEAHFGGALKFEIVWGDPPRPRRRRRQTHITLGTCQSKSGRIRIHPILDSHDVPLYYVEFIVHHEMAHIVVPSRPGASGRILHHGRDFREVERRYPHHRLAMAWQEKHLGKLLERWSKTARTNGSSAPGQTMLF